MVTQDHINQIVGVIKSSKDADDLTKRICLFLLGKTEMLETPVIIEILKTDLSGAAMYKIGTGVHDMVSDAYHTHLNGYLRETGSPLRLGSAYGDDFAMVFINQNGPERKHRTSYKYQNVAADITAIEL